MSDLPQLGPNEDLDVEMEMDADTAERLKAEVGDMEGVTITEDGIEILSIPTEEKRRKILKFLNNEKTRIENERILAILKEGSHFIDEIYHLCKFFEKKNDAARALFRMRKEGLIKSVRTNRKGKRRRQTLFFVGE